MPNTLDTLSTNQLTTLVTFRTPVAVFKYCIWTEDLTIGADTFTAIPEMEVTLDKMHGGLKDENFRITMPLTFEPLKTMLTTDPYAFVKVEVEECDVLNAAATRRWLARGEIQEALSNAGGRTGLVDIKAVSTKEFANIALGVLATSLCSWTFGDSQCQINVAAKRESGTLSAINGNNVTVTGLTTTLVNGYWRFGYVEKDGIRLLIKNYVTGSIFELVRRPPASWIATSVTLTPGCDKTIETCRARWNNEQHYGGFGRQMPDYHPLFESPRKSAADS